MLLHSLLKSGHEGIPLGGDFVFNVEDALAEAALGLLKSDDLFLEFVLFRQRGGLMAAALEVADLALGVFEFLLGGELHVGGPLV